MGENLYDSASFATGTLRPAGGARPSLKGKTTKTR